jgi:branched-chain amino acid transport system permease protein
MTVLLLHLAVLALLAGLQFVVPPFQHSLLVRLMILAAYAAGYNVLLGYAGLMSLGHALFFATGMYATGLTIFYLHAGAPLAFVIGVAASLSLTAVFGVLALRATGVAFLIVTMMFAQVGYLVAIYFNQITGGDQGLVLAGRVPPIHLSGLLLPLDDPAVRYNAALAVLAVALLLNLWLTRTPAGRVLRALRGDEERVKLLGYNTFHYRLLALVLSGGISGMAGSAYALLFSYVGASFVSTLYSIYPLVSTLLGGVGTTLGPLVGASFMTYVVDIASSVTPGYLIVLGVTLVTVIRWAPDGILGRVRARWVRWLP